MPDDSYKILGELDDPSKVGVLGRNTATTGTPIGVEGTVGTDSGYGLYTSDDAYVGSNLEATSASTEALSVTDETGSTLLDAGGTGSVLSIDFTSSDDSDHALELVDRVQSNTEQLSIRGDATGSSEIVFQDISASNYKWGLRASGTNDFFIDNHENLTSRVQFVKEGPTRLLSRKTVFDGAADGTAIAILGGDVDASGNKVVDVGKNVTTVSTDITLQNDAHDLVLVDTSSGDVTLTLPPDPPEGASFTCKQTAASNATTVDGNGGTIDGTTTVSLATEHESIVVTADGDGNWWIEARFAGGSSL